MQEMVQLLCVSLRVDVCVGGDDDYNGSGTNGGSKCSEERGTVERKNRFFYVIPSFVRSSIGHHCLLHTRFYSFCTRTAIVQMQYALNGNCWSIGNMFSFRLCSANVYTTLDTSTKQWTKKEKKTLRIFFVSSSISVCFINFHSSDFCRHFHMIFNNI